MQTEQRDVNYINDKVLRHSFYCWDGNLQSTGTWFIYGNKINRTVFLSSKIEDYGIFEIKSSEYTIILGMNGLNN